MSTDNNDIKVFEELNTYFVRYGIFKSLRGIKKSLLGKEDFDILVHEEDHELFINIIKRHGALKSKNAPLLTNLYREDWFLPLNNTIGYLHLDVHTKILLGGKFKKEFYFCSYKDIERWDQYKGIIPIASKDDEAKVTLARIAFRQNFFSRKKYFLPKGDMMKDIFFRLFIDNNLVSYNVKFDNQLTKNITIFRCKNSLKISTKDLNSLRTFVLDRNNASIIDFIINRISSNFREYLYLFSRLFNKIYPGLFIDRRKPLNGGLVVGIVAPDGIGKSTQAKLIKKIFNWKFSVFSVYLGTGNGDGWLIRRLIRYLFKRSKSMKRANINLLEKTSSNVIKDEFFVLLKIIWGLIVAQERYSKVKRIFYLKNKGFIVISDRWPQSMEEGYMDGPVKLKKLKNNKLLSYLKNHEKRIYEKMDKFKPDVLIHLEADYQTSKIRKPGEIKEVEFKKRAELMRKSRKINKEIYLIDAKKPIESITKEIFNLIWKKL